MPPTSSATAGSKDDEPVVVDVDDDDDQHGDDDDESWGTWKTKDSSDPTLARPQLAKQVEAPDEHDESEWEPATGDDARVCAAMSALEAELNADILQHDVDVNPKQQQLAAEGDDWPEFALEGEEQQQSVVGAEEQPVQQQQVAQQRSKKGSVGAYVQHPMSISGAYVQQALGNSSASMRLGSLPKKRPQPSQSIPKLIEAKPGTTSVPEPMWLPAPMQLGAKPMKRHSKGTSIAVFDDEKDFAEACGGHHEHDDTLGDDAGAEVCHDHDDHDDPGAEVCDDHDDRDNTHDDDPNTDAYVGEAMNRLEADLRADIARYTAQGCRKQPAVGSGQSWEDHLVDKIYVRLKEQWHEQYGPQPARRSDGTKAVRGTSRRAGRMVQKHAIRQELWRMLR